MSRPGASTNPPRLGPLILPAFVMLSCSTIVTGTVLTSLRPETLLVETHVDPTFRLSVVRDPTGSASFILRARRGRSPFATDIAAVGEPDDRPHTPLIDAASLRFEWHEDRGLVALRGSTLADDDLYLALASFAPDGTVSEVEFDPDERPRTEGAGLNAAVQRAHHLAIESFIDPLAANGDQPSSMPSGAQAWSATQTPIGQPNTPTPIPPTHAPPRTATATRTPWPDDAPAPIAITLAEAERMVLDLAIPEVDRRIERSYVTSQAGLLETFQDGVFVSTEHLAHACLLLDRGPGVPEWCEYPFDVHGLAIIVVEASDAWLELYESTLLDALYGDADGMASGTYEGSEFDGVIAPSRPRKDLVALIEGSTGEIIGFMSGGRGDVDESRPVLPAIDPARLITATVLPSPPTATERPWWSGTPTPLPIPDVGDAIVPWSSWSEPIPLADGEVPAQIMDTARTFPIVAGAWWRYRTTQLSNDAYWHRSERTIRVVRSERIAPGIVRSEIAEEPIRHGTVSAIDSSATWWYLFSTGVAGRPNRVGSRDATLVDIREFMSQLPFIADGRVRVDEPPLDDAIRIPLTLGDHAVYRWSLVQFGTRTEAGKTFEGCAMFHTILSAAITAEHSICPGVGIVRSEIPMLGKYWFASIVVEELIDYHIPELIEIP